MLNDDSRFSWTACPWCLGTGKPERDLLNHKLVSEVFAAEIHNQLFDSPSCKDDVLWVRLFVDELDSLFSQCHDFIRAQSLRDGEGHTAPSIIRSNQRASLL